MAEIEDVNLNLWSFIKSTQATRLASLKSIQKFILSLNKTELTHLITFYLQSKLSKRNLTLKQTEHELLNNEPNGVLQTIDKQIISKLNAKYGTKYHKKVISNTTQRPKTDECNAKHLLLIPQQVLAYSFQFLSFQELCQAQTVCVHFMYLNKQYPALTHYYLRMNNIFCQHAMRSRVRLSDLSFFKHIDIGAAYYGLGRHCYADQKRRANLFQYVLRTIIRQSKSSLDVLSIFVPYLGSIHNAAFDCPPFNVLLCIMNEVDQLPISKLLWSRDYVKPSRDRTVSDVLLTIQSKFVHFLPRLTSLSIVGSKMSFAEDVGGSSWTPVSSTVLPFAPMQQYILTPTIIDFGSKLQSLQIDVNGGWNLLQRHGNVIQCIAKHMPILKRLVIQTNLRTYDDIAIDDMMDSNHISPHTQLRVLKLRVVGYWGNFNNVACVNDKILHLLFDTFIGITKFEYEPGLPSTSPGINWVKALGRLIENKRTYSITE
eukprot:443907_1